MLPDREKERIEDIISSYMPCYMMKVIVCLKPGTLLNIIRWMDDLGFCVLFNISFSHIWMMRG